MTKRKTPPSRIRMDVERGTPSMLYKFGTRKKELDEGNPSKGPAAFGLSFARVIRVDYATHECVLQVWQGEQDVFQRTTINTYPGAGARSFMGTMPEPGDVCVVGWMATTERVPMILAWVPIGVTAGIEWLPVQDFLPAEVDFNPKKVTEWEGIYTRNRYKMRSMSPGSVFVSSSHGSDIYMDEGIQLSNRRGTEIRLRDQDQAIVFRSQQEFHATGGTRVYSGMVQRDGASLPARMFSDGVYWDAPIQEESGDPLTPEQLGQSPIAEDSLTPHQVFLRSDVSLPFADSGIQFEDNVDPYSFLSRSLLIGPDGFALSPDTIRAGAEYGGKPIFRVSVDPNPENTDPPVNGAIGEDLTDNNTLTEYRIELDHTWDGTLPVTEQTDGFDADRLPSDANQEEALASNRPYVEWVLGSVVGNDPNTQKGRVEYGLPLVPRIFSQDKIDPRLESGLGMPMSEHAASLFQVTNPIQTNGPPPMFVSTTKDGRVKAFLSGPQNENSLELAATGDIRIETQGRMSLNAGYLDLNFRTADPVNNCALALKSDTGAILISGANATTKGSFSSRDGTGGIPPDTLPSVCIEAPSGNLHLNAGRVTKMSASEAIQMQDTNAVSMVSKQSISSLSDKILSSCNTRDRTVQGRETQLFSGPLNLLPSNAPFRETKIIGTPLTGHAGGNTDEYSMIFGDRTEKIRIGNHSTDVTVGNMTYSTIQGNWNARAGVGQMKLDSTQGMSVTIPTGTISMTSTSATSVTALASISLKSNGSAKLSGSVVTLGGNGKSGRILSGSDIDPVSGKTFGALGLGSPGHFLGPNV